MNRQLAKFVHGDAQFQRYPGDEAVRQRPEPEPILLCCCRKLELRRIVPMGRLLLSVQHTSRLSADPAQVMPTGRR